MANETVRVAQLERAVIVAAQRWVDWLDRAIQRGHYSPTLPHSTEDRLVKAVRTLARRQKGKRRGHK